MLLSVDLASAAQSEPPAQADGGDAAPAEAKAAKAEASEHESAGFFHATGSLRASYWSSDRLLSDLKDVGSAAAWLKLTAQPHDKVALFAEGWARSDNVFKGTDKRYLTREAYADVMLGSLDLRLGRQIIAWGRADRINPTDNLTPRDFTLLVPEVDDDRFGLLSAKATYHWEQLSLTGVWLPDFRPHKVPLPRESTPITVAPGVVVDATSQFSEEVPSAHRSWAVKLDSSGKAVDWSISYFDGFDLNPDLSVTGVTSSPSAITTSVKLSHHRLRVFGVDGATTAGAFGLRAEAAYAWSEDSGGTDPFVKNPSLYVVLGGERTFLDNLNVNVQYFTRYVRYWRDPFDLGLSRPFSDVAVQQAILNNERDRSQHGVTVRVGKKWFNETLEAELAAVWDITRRGYFLRPRVIYAFTDKLKGTIGADYYAGPDDSFFGRLEDNRTVFAELSYWF